MAQTVALAPSTICLCSNATFSQPMSLITSPNNLIRSDNFLHCTYCFVENSKLFFSLSNDVSRLEALRTETISNLFFIHSGMEQALSESRINKQSKESEDPLRVSQSQVSYLTLSHAPNNSQHLPCLSWPWSLEEAPFRGQGSKNLELSSC